MSHSRPANCPRLPSWRRPAALLLLALGGPGCTVLNGLDVCEGRSHDTKLNVVDDSDEQLTGPASLIDVGGQQLALAYALQAADQTQELHVAYVDSVTGVRTAGCGRTLERLYSGASHAWLAAAGFPPDQGRKAVLAVGRIETDMVTVAYQGRSGETLTEIVETPCWQIELLDAAGCPLNGRPLPPVPAGTGALAWSSSRAQLLSVSTDSRTLEARWSDTPTAAIQIDADEGIMGRNGLGLAMDEAGRSLLLWSRSETTGSTLQLRAALLDADGELTAASLAGGRPRPFEIELPVPFERAVDRIQLAAAARDGHFAFAVSVAASPSAPHAVYVGELNAQGALLRTPEPIDPNDESEQSFPFVQYLPGGELLVAWDSAGRPGTRARVLGTDWQTRFNTVSCRETSFDVGNIRERAMQGNLGISGALTDGRLWLARSGTSESDRAGGAVVGWSIPLKTLLVNPD